MELTGSVSNPWGSNTDPLVELTGSVSNPWGSNTNPLVEVLTAYSHTTHLADLQICVKAPPSDAVSAVTPAAKRPWSLRDRLDERTRADLVAAYDAGSTAASLATTHGLSLSSVKRLLAAAGVRRKQLLA